MRLRRLGLLLAPLTIAAAAFGADAPAGGPPDAFQIGYVSNLDVEDSVLTLTNTGTQSGEDPAGRICVNIYTFDAAEEMASCCACPVTPNGLNSFSDRAGLIPAPLTPGTPTSLVVKLVATVPVGGSCNAGNSGNTFLAAQLASGLRAWGTNLHASPAGYQVTENAFQPAVLSVSESAKLTAYCNFIQIVGSGFGICRRCGTGALGAAAR